MGTRPQRLQGGGAEYWASESDFETARIGVLAETITTYFEIVNLRRRAVLARETVDVLQEREALAATRYDRGLAGSFELYQIRQDLRNAQAGLPRTDAALAGAEGRLALLLGGYRRDADAILPDSVRPAIPAEPIPAGVPADLVHQRPDVRAAGLRLDAARLRIGARRAELIPSLSLSGSIGVQSSETGGLFDVDQWFRNLAANLTAPLFQGGRLRNNVELAHAVFDQAAAAYGRTVVTAVQEAEAALAALHSEGQRNAFLTARREEAAASADLQATRYAAGVGGYSDYLDAVRTLLAVESGLVDAQQAMALARLAVHRALGGAWTSADALPELRMVPPQEGSR